MADNSTTGSDNLGGTPGSGLQRRTLARVLKTVLGAFFLLILLSGSMMLVFLPIFALTGESGWEVTVPVSIGERSVLGVLPLDGIESNLEGADRFRLLKARGELRFETSDARLIIGHLALLVLTLGLFLWGIHLLRQILAATADGQAFHPANPGRLNTLGWLILVVSLAAGFLEYLASRSVLSRLQVDSPPLSPAVAIHVGWIICGLLVLILAAVWKEAVRIAEEQSLTV